MKLFVLVFGLKGKSSSAEYEALRWKLVGFSAQPVLEGVWAFRCERTAAELREWFRSALKPGDRILVLEVASFATRRALTDLASIQGLDIRESQRADRR